MLEPFVRVKNASLQPFSPRTLIDFDSLKMLESTCIVSSLAIANTAMSDVDSHW